MEDKQLDKMVSEKLKGLEQHFEPMAWESLEAKLDQVEVDFDEAIRSKIGDADYTYQPWYWNMLSQQMDAQAALKRRLINVKSIELVLLLLIFTFFQLFYSSNQNKYQATSTGAISPVILTDTVEQNKIIEQETLTTDQLEQEFTDYLTHNEQVYKSAPTLTPKLLEPIPKKDRTLKNVLESKSISTVTTVNSENTSLETVNELENTTLALLATVPPNINLGQSPTSDKKSQLELGMFITTNVDRIYTPYDEILNVNAYVRSEVGYGGGISIRKQFDKIGVTTGLIYSHKKHLPKLSAILFSNHENDFNIEGIQDIELQTVQVPLTVNYSVWENEKNSVHFLVGTSIHIVTQANYDVASVRANYLLNTNDLGRGERELQLTPYQLSRFKRFARQSDPQSEKLQEKKFPDGWLSGGTFSENSYYTANVGFSFERYVNDKTLLFIQPTYKHDLPFLSNGIGPNRNRISTFELQLGTRIVLK